MLNYAAAWFSSKHNSQPKERKREKNKRKEERIKRDPKIYITEKKDDPCSIVRKC